VAETNAEVALAPLAQRDALEPASGWRSASSAAIGGLRTVAVFS